MTFNFPNSPTLNQTYSFGNKSWIYNGSAWILQNVQVNPITLNSTFITSNVTLNANVNGFSVGPVTQAANTTVTIATGQRWVVI